MHLLKLGKALLVFLPLAAILGISNWANILAEKMPDLSSPSDEVSNTDSVMRIDLDANEIIFNPHDQTLYATRPSRIGEMGNSLTRINPYNGEIGPSVFVGSEPSLMALSDDGQAMYVALDGAYAIRRYDVATHTPGLQFSIGRGQSVNASDAPFRASDIAVLPGDPNTLAVARSNPGMSPSGVGVAVFDNGVRRPLTGPGHSDGANYLAFASPTTLYGGGHTGGLRTMTVGPDGVIDQGSMSSFAVRRLKLDGNKAFDGLGHVFDPATRTLIGTCAGINTDAFVPDAANERVLYAVKQGSSNIVIRACDIRTFLTIGEMVVPNTGSDITAVNMVRFGTNGLAMRTWDKKLHLIRTSLLPTSDPLPPPSPTPAVSPTPTVRPFSQYTRQVDLPNNDLIYRESEGKFYATVRETGGSYANSLVRIDPATATIEDALAVGTRPGRLEFTADEQKLYIGINATNSIKRFDMQSQSSELEFPLGGNLTAYDIDVVPNAPNSVAVSYGNTSYNYDGADIYDNGVKRPLHAQRSGTINIRSADLLYVGEYYLGKYGITPQGLALQEELTTGGHGASQLVDDLLYNGAGIVTNLATKDVLGSFNGGGAGLTVDIPNNRIFFLSPDGIGSPNSWSIKAYRLDNFLPVGSVSLPGVTLDTQPWAPYRLFRWGENGLAFGDYQEKLYFLVSDLVGPTPSGSIPWNVRLGSASGQADEEAGSITVTVLRSGGLTGTSTVDYATSDGTAEAGSDYVATSGTLTFAPGETSKTVAISIIGDNILESDETFGFALSNATGPGSLGIAEPSSAVYTIVNNDFGPFSTVVNVQVFEPATVGATTDAVFSVQLSNPTSLPASVQFTTVDGTATAGSDYVPTSGTLQFAPLETTKTITVQVLGDANFAEPNESFGVRFQNSVNMGIGTFVATGTIINYNPSASPTPYPSPIPTPSPTPTPTPSPTPTPTPTPTPSPVPSPSVTPSPLPPSAFVRRVAIPARDIVFSSADSSLYASVASEGGEFFGNTLTKINPANGAIGTPVFVGSEPTIMAISDDGNTIYVKLDGAKSVRRFDVSTQTPQLQFVPEGSFWFLHDMAVQPGNPDVLAIANGVNGGVAIFDNGVRRPMWGNGGAYSINSISFASPTTLFGYNREGGGGDLINFTVSSSGVSGTHAGTGLNGSSRIQYSSPYVYGDSGRVVAPPQLIGTYTGGGGMMAIDRPAGRIFFLNGTVLTAFNIDTFAQLGSVNIPGLSIAGGRLIRWGENGLAVRGTDQIYLIQSALVSPNAPVPTGLQMAAGNYNRTESGGTVQVTINRTGNLVGTTTVNYATVNGTAVGGSDFTPVSGILTFTHGQATKTVSIPITNDTIYEGNENFRFILSDPGGDLAELLSPESSVITIQDNDSQPSVTGPNIIVAEPRSHPTSEGLTTVRLSNPTVHPVEVTYSTTNITATAGSDYLPASGTLTFEPLETVKTVAVQVLADENHNEPSESFRLTFIDSSNAWISSQQPTVTITNYNPRHARHAPFDHDDDGRTDFSVFRPSTGAWYQQRSTLGFQGLQFGAKGDKLTPADYDGDGKSDISVYRPSSGTWYILRSGSATLDYPVFGVGEDLPAPGDYDGDGKADLTVFRPSQGTWYRRNSSDGSFFGMQFGQNGDLPTVGDFDGDGKSDLGIWRPANGDWYHIRSLDGTVFGERFGQEGDKIVPADYDGDVKTDIAIFRPATGLWVVRNSATATYSYSMFGAPADIPVPGEYDGDGKADIGVWRPSDGTWYIQRSSNGSFLVFPWGQNGDVPTPSAFGN